MASPTTISCCLSECPTTPGHDFGNQIEIVSGLKADDQVIINPPDSIVSGQQVQIVQATLPGDNK
jgi:hypothetical protein